MDQTINNFIDELVKVLKYENKNREYHEKRLLDIFFMIAPLKQQLNDLEYLDLITDISNYNISINYTEDNTDGYTNGYIDIYFYKKDEQDERSFKTPEIHSYKIEFGKEQRIGVIVNVLKKIRIIELIKIVVVMVVIGLLLHLK